MTKKNALFATVFGLAVFWAAGIAPSYAQSRNVEINLDVLNNFKPEKAAPSPGPEQAPLTGLSKEVPLYKPLPPLPLTKPVEPAPPVVTQAPQTPIEPPPAPITVIEPVAKVEVTPPQAPSVAAPVKLSPPVPQQRPTVLNAPQSFIERARADYQEKQPKPEEPAAVKRNNDRTAPPLNPNDPLERNLVNPSVQDILASIDPDAASGALTPRKLTLAYQPGVTELPVEIRDTLSHTLLNSIMTTPTARVEIQAYASSDEGTGEARRISLTRALEIREFLVKNGINPSTINLRSLGQDGAGGPADRVDIVVSP